MAALGERSTLEASPLLSSAETKEHQLRNWFANHAPVLIAFSGGVDSSYLSFIAHQELGDRALSVTAISPSFPQDQHQEINRMVAEWKLNHHWIHTQEMEREPYRSNPVNRCYFCKNELFTHLLEIARQQDFTTICDGNNADDTGDYRPGMQAGRELGVRSPLIEVGLTKAEIRERSRVWKLPTAEKPASPCLSSRIPYGMPVTIQKLSAIERGERAIRQLGFSIFRLRHHGDIARIEISPTELPRALDPVMAQQLVAALKPLGFLYIALDLEGFRSGALNTSVTLPGSQSPAPCLKSD
ncbi:MAG: ATP-dependent sacrificial sulfur transferase LarE [Acidobacteria bacterium]|nr:ATP-dependent sacrificial sulfur transferase LarE [Acidobacteriota bacterium]